MLSIFSVFSFAETGYVGNEKCDLLSVKGKKKSAALCYKQEVKDNIEIIDEYRELFEISTTHSPKQKKENLQKLDGYMKAINESCKDDECRANETRQVVNTMNQIMLQHNSKK